LNQSERVKIVASIKKHILTHHINVAGVNYDAWSKMVDECTPELLTADIAGFESGVQQLLSKLGSSHTVFYHGSGHEVLPQHSINATLRGVQMGGHEHWMFLDVFDEGPAHVAGIRPGDLLIAVDGVSNAPPAVPPFRTGQAYMLTVSNSRREDTRDLMIQIPARKGTKARPPIVEPKSLVHMTLPGNIGLLKIAYFPGAFGVRFAKTLDEAIKNLKDKGCDRLIIDLRGNIGGSLGFARLASYMSPGKVPIGHSLTPRRLRTGYHLGALPRVPMPDSKVALLFTLGRFAFRDKSVVLLTQGLGKQPFHNKIALLVNECTNSAAEMVASFASENGLATVIGNKTAGHVLGAVNLKVGGGYWLRLPVFGWYTSRGESLEGKGVIPDLVVDVDPLLLNAGVDQQMEKAIEVTNDIAGRVSGAATPFPKVSDRYTSPAP